MRLTCCNYGHIAEQEAGAWCSTHMNTIFFGWFIKKTWRRCFGGDAFYKTFSLQKVNSGARLEKCSSLLAVFSGRMKPLHMLDQQPDTQHESSRHAGCG